MDDARQWSVPVIALPVAVLLLSVACAAEIPLRYLSPGTALGGFALGVMASFRVLWAPILFFVQIAALLSWRPSRPILARVRLAAAALLCLAVASQSYLALIEDPAFARLPAIAVFYLLMAAALWGWLMLEFLRPFRPSAGTRGRRLLAVGIPAAMLVAAAVIGLCNQTIFPDDYESLQMSACHATFLFLTAGIASVILRVDAERLARWLGKRASWALYLGISLAILAVPASGTAVIEKTRSIHRRFTALGRSEASLRSDVVSLLASDAAVSLYDPHGEEKFDRFSNMPETDLDLAKSRFNILLISVECLRYKDSSFGDPGSDLTPHLRKLSERSDSILFERAYSPSAMTLQVFSSIFSMVPTSMSSIELWDHWHGELPPRARTVSELLLEDGYRTFYAGHDYRGRFSKDGTIRGLQQGFTSRSYVYAEDREAGRDDTDELIVEKGRDQIEEARKGSEPFFGWVFFVSPHEPYYPHYPEMEGEEDRDLYRQELRYADEQIGALLSYLRNTPMWDDTIVIVHGDHGEAFGEHGKNSHADVYTETTHVPLVVRIPGQEVLKVTKPVSLSYLFPWMLSRGPKHARAASLSVKRSRLGPLLEKTRGSVVVEMLRPRGIRTAIVMDDHELVFDDRSEHMEVFDLVGDPGQTKDIYSPKRRTTRRLVGRLKAYLSVRGALAKPLSKQVVEAPERKPAIETSGKKK